MTRSLTYTQYTDYYIPNISLSKTAIHKPIGKYGRMRKAYLQKQRPVLWNHMILSETLYPHLCEIDEMANRRLNQMMPELMRQNGVQTHGTVNPIIHGIYGFLNMWRITAYGKNENSNSFYTTRRIIATTYKVKVAFKNTGAETMEDKILRLICNQVVINGGTCAIMDSPQMSRQPGPLHQRPPGSPGYHRRRARRLLRGQVWRPVLLLCGLLWGLYPVQLCGAPGYQERPGPYGLRPGAFRSCFRSAWKSMARWWRTISSSAPSAAPPPSAAF